MPILRSLTLLALGLAAAPLSAAETFSLREDPSAGATRSVVADVTGEGTFEFQPPEREAKPVTHPVTLKGSFRFAERRLPPAGRDEAAFRALRRFQEARSEIRVGGQTSVPRLRDERANVVARGTRKGVSSYSPDGPLTATEAELLPFPGDPLLLAALLPSREVTVGETWTPDAWVAPAMAGAEVSLNSKMTCRLESVRDGRATVRFDGEVEGATKGATSKTALSGTLGYDVAAAAVVAAELTHTEKRSIGPLAPGMSLTLKSVVQRTPAPADAAIADAETAAVPLDPPAEALWIEHAAPFGVTLAAERDWQVFHQTGQLVILRLLDQGGLVAQCNVAPAPKVKPGERTPERQFQEDIRRSLGEQLSEITAAEEIQNGTGLAVYRVTATGKVRESDRLWRYYLVTAPDGRQAAFVFTIEPATLGRLGKRDLELVLSATFPPQSEPTPARR
ncbi:MAG TPA: hypothetical protein VF170_09755 [Planctomycetaceae bacterium]